MKESLQIGPCWIYSSLIPFSLLLPVLRGFVSFR
ncbi:hypothetical protein F383_38485 [Gossypium arboreum]|uniref:Uncharacterized protein n=1 Tax=Gossypium arboreum TaxID=29729 RepID=A0A0B0MFE9_GOSAR|nr:hypothetical protein F383_38485 [Gossypium arboreum]